MAKILVTRPEPAASRTAHALAKQGHTIINCPVFEIRDTSNPMPENNYQGLIFTSRNAIDTLLDRGWSPSNLLLPVFCVGENTASAAAMLGFKDIRTGSGKAESLANLISNSTLPRNFRLLYPAASDRKFDFEAALKQRELIVETLEIYKVDKLSPSKEELSKAFEQAAGGATLIYSARGGSHLSDLIGLYELEPSLCTLTCIAISATAVESINKFAWQNILTAPTPDESAMTKLANEIT